jgi:hypothetical protein
MKQTRNSEYDKAEDGILKINFHGAAALFFTASAQQ